MEHKRRLLLLWVLVISVIGSAVLSTASAGSRLSFVADSYTDKNQIYLIDDKGKDISIIKADAKGQKQADINVRKVSDGQMTTLDYLTPDGEQVYVYGMKRDIESNQVLSESVYLCDFGKNRLTEVWQLPVVDTEGQNNFSIAVRDGQLTYFSVLYDDQTFLAQAVLHTMKNGETKEKTLAVVNYDLGIGFTDFFYSDQGDIIVTTPEGKIFQAQKPVSPIAAEGSPLPIEPMQAAPDVEAVAASQMKEDKKAPPLQGVPQYEAVPLYPANGTSSGHMTNFSTDGKHTIYFMDLELYSFCSIDLSKSQGKTTVDMPRFAYQGEPITLSALKNIRFVSEENFSAAISVGDNKTLLGTFQGEEGKIYEKLTVSATTRVLHGILYFLGIWACFFVLYILRGLFLTISKGRLPILVKVIAACIPVVIGSILVLQYLINSMFVGQTIENQYKELYLVSKQQMEGISSQLLSEIDITNPYDNVYYYELRQILNALPSASQVYEQQTEAKAVQSAKSAQSVYDFSYHWLYKVEGNQLTSLYCGQNYIDVPIDYYYDEDTAALLYNAVREKKTMKGSLKDVGGDWIVLAIPILDEEDKVVAIMETGTTKASLEQAVYENTKKINLANLGILIILVLVLSVLLMICLAPLKRLKQSVFDIINGNLGVQTKAAGRDEVAEIGQVFNQMSRSIEVNVNELTQLNQGYFKFVPERMFRLLHKSSVVDVRLGDQVNAEITILSFNVVKFEQLVSSMNAEEMFQMINRILSNMVPVVTMRGGVVDKFENAGLIAFYTKGSENALTSAVSVCQTMEQMNAAEAFGKGIALEMTSGISHGPVMIGIVGHAERLAATTISEHTNLSGFLQKIGPKYGARILITASAKAQISDFDSRFNARWLGFLHVSVNDSTERLYDVFDGDEEENRILKGQTKALFERGVSLYCEKDFYEARLVFIEVLKQNRNDGAAKEYLYRCDQYYQMADTQSISINIEEY